MKKKYIHESKVEYYINKITDQVKDAGITKIVTLAKGGYVPARALAKTLNIRRIYSVGVEFYEAEGQTIEVPHVYQHLTEDFKDNDVILIVDDITDTGNSMQVALQEVIEHNGKNIITCCLLHKPKSSFIPNVYGQKVDNDVWFDFFFE